MTRRKLSRSDEVAVREMARKREDPLEIVEEILHAQEWPFERRSRHEVAAEMPGHWCDFGLFFAFSPRFDALHVSCTYDILVPGEGRGPLYELIARANEKVWLGHFSFWSEEGIPMVSHTLLFDPEQRVGQAQIADVIEVVLEEAERFYPAFQYVLRGGHPPHSALEAALLETVGEA